MNPQKLLLNNLKKAFAVEEKQRFTNTGVLGGFHAFLLGAATRLKELFPNQDISLLREIGEHYSQWSPLKRSESFPQLVQWAEQLERDLYTEVAGLEENVDYGSEKKESVADIMDYDAARGSKEEKKKKFNGEQGHSTGESLYSVKAPVYSVKARGYDSESSDYDVRKTEIVKRTESLQFVKGVGPERVKQLARLGIKTVEDLLLYYPRRYEERKHKQIEELKHGELVTIVGKVVAGSVTSGRTKVVKLTLENNGRTVIAVWFNQTYILKQYPAGTYLSIAGKVRWQQRIPEIQVTDAEKINTLPLSGEGDKKSGEAEIIPVYPETAQLSSKFIRSLIQRLAPEIPAYFPEILPPGQISPWMERTWAYREIHFPSSRETLAEARKRLVFEEILFLQLAVAKLRKGETGRESPVLNKGRELLARFFKSLPFSLTKAQQRVVQEIFNDLSQTKTMARLIQGDVGSGKTAVAMAALLQAVGSGYQGAMMAPTEILALQHYLSLDKAFTPLGIKTVLLHGNLNKSERQGILGTIRDGEAHIIVGTHALIQEEVEFKSLGLAVTDEQHRFGVRQRSLLQEKGKAPHVLVMTATPIPRTLALTLYGDLQLSVLDEMPAGRKPVITKHLSERGRPSLEKFMSDQLALGRQIYVVCPLVEESEAIDTISATERAAQLAESFSRHSVVLLHGRMKSGEKEEIMRGFQAGEIHILVSTTVVEVGVNVPNASVMVVEGAERFGLAQLHQLRGRVGRGSEQSYCILMSDNRNSRRLKILCQTNDGFKIAEEDLQLRGPGELFGTRQHGLAELRLADLSQDGKLVEQAYQFMQKVLADPVSYQEIYRETDRFFPPEKIGLN